MKVYNSIEAFRKQYGDKYDDILESILEWDKAKERLSIRVIPIEGNEEKLESVPHKTILDMAVVYYVDVDGKNGISIPITNTLFEEFIKRPPLNICYNLEANNILSTISECNIRMENPITVKGITQTLNDLIGISTDPFETEDVYVATTSNKPFGACVLAFPVFLQDIALKLNGSYYILPSSVHEVILIKAGTEGLDPKTLKEMVIEVNATEVDPQDKLTDNVYFYNAETGELSFADFSNEETSPDTDCQYCSELFTGDANEDLITHDLKLDINGFNFTPFQFNVFIMDNELELFADYGDAPIIKQKIKINYCPMCGRRLVKE